MRHAVQRPHQHRLLVAGHRRVHRLDGAGKHPAGEEQRQGPWDAMVGEVPDVPRRQPDCGVLQSAVQSQPLLPGFVSQQ